jgi:hypothetical protein
MAPAGIVLGAAGLALAAVVLAGQGAPASVAPPASPADFAVPAELRPLLELHCVACHEGARAKGGFELAAVLEATAAWMAVL